MNGEIIQKLDRLKTYFETGATREYAFRRAQLQKLKDALMAHEQEIYAALYEDLKKNPEECWVTELGFVISEISYALKNLKSWMKPKAVGTNLLNQPSRSHIRCEPLGVVLLISPWNYPLQLLLTPLVGAIAAGNCAVLKPSEHAPATAAVIQKVMAAAFPADYILEVPGDGAEVIPAMMSGFRFDYVFYTGSIPVGTLIYKMAADKLVPVTLELGGKSPCIVERDADLKVAARRIAVTKFSNAGQMCVAPDYLLVHRSIRAPFLEELKRAIESFYNAEAVRGYHYGKIVNERQFNRLQQYMKEGTVLYGGSSDAATLFIEPTLLTDVSHDAKVMQEEIFGPLLPVLDWEAEEEVVRAISRHPDPLAFYVFTGSRERAD